MICLKSKNIGTLNISLTKMASGIIPITKADTTKMLGFQQFNVFCMPSKSFQYASMDRFIC